MGTADWCPTYAEGSAKPQRSGAGLSRRLRNGLLKLCGVLLLSQQTKNGRYLPALRNVAEAKAEEGSIFLRLMSLRLFKPSVRVAEP